MSGNLSTFEERVERFIRVYGMLGAQDRVLVAVSGGADSVALLQVLCRLGYTVEAGHFDHQTRGGESRVDAVFTGDLAKGLGIPCHQEKESIEAGAVSQGRSFEDYARERRYAFLYRIARERGCTVVATGHHADDQAETVLMRLIRGSSPSGLGGISPVREVDGIRLIRPLLGLARHDIRSWLRAQGQVWREDASNSDRKMPRNRLRLGLLPELEREYNPRVREALNRLAEAQRCEDDLLEQIVSEMIATCVEVSGAIDRVRFRECHEALRRRMVLRLAWGHGIDCPYERVLAATSFIAEGATGQRFDLGSGVVLYNGRTHTEFVEMMPEPPQCVEEIRLRVPGETVAFGRRYSARLLLGRPMGRLSDYCTPSRQVFDADTMTEGVWVRHWRPGDRIVPYGMTGSRKLQDYFVDIGLPEPRRDNQPLLVTREHIAWVVGHATSAVTAVTSLTRRILEIEVESCD